MQQQNQLIATLEVFIKKFYKNQIVKGLAIIIAILLPLFLLFVALEFKGHFSTLTRTVLFYGFVLFSIFVALKFIVAPLIKLYGLSKKRLKHAEAAQIIGTHFSEIKDKLLNTMQLSANLQDSSNDLLLASVNQKMEEMKPFNFSKAINTQASKRMMKYALMAVLLLFLVFTFQSNVIFEGSNRLLKYNTEFVQKAPFIFDFTKPKAAKKGDDYMVKLNLVGDVVPADAYLEIDGQWVKMAQNKTNNFTFNLSNIQKDIPIRFKADDFTSEFYTIPVVAPASLSNISIKLNYPSYTGRKTETLNSSSDLNVPEGTLVEWNIATKNADRLTFLHNGKALEGDNFYKLKPRENGTYSIVLFNNILTQKDSLNYQIEVIKDKHPVINVEQKQDSLSSKLLYFVGTANDDYGISKLKFYYQLAAESGMKNTFNIVPVSIGNSSNEVFSYVFDLTKIDFELGSKVNFFFEVYDNDGVNGAKATRSGMMEYKAPTADELEQLTDKGNNDLVARMDNAIKTAKQIQQLTKELQVKMNNANGMDWQEKQKMSQLLEMQKMLEKEVSEISKQQEKNRTREKEFKKEDPKTAEKQELLDKMFKETMSPEMKELFKKLEELLKQENKEGMKQQLDKMNQADKDVSKNLDRLQEQLKQIELEKQINETADKLDKLAEKQETLKKETEQKKGKDEALQKKQEELNKDFDKLKEDFKDIEKKNAELKDKLDLKSTEDAEKKIDEAQDKAQENLDKGKNDKAGEQQQKAADEMKEAAKEMRDNLEKEMKKREEEDYKTLRQLLENLIVLSHDQEKTMTELKQQPSYTPKFIELSRNQQKIKRDAEMIEDSLLALSKRNIAIQSFVNTEISQRNNHMDKSLHWLSERNAYMAGADQQYVMTSVNNLAVMLSEALKNMQAKMNEMKKGPPKVGQCKNPGTGKGEGKPKPGEGKPSVGAMKKLQEDLNKMGEERKDGKKPGSGENGAMSSEEFARMAAQQEALRRALEALQKQLQEQGKGNSLGDLEKTKELMEQTEKDLVNKKYDAQTIQRQKEIAIRLSQHEKAQQEQEQDEKRQGETGKEKPRTIPPSLQPYIEELKKQQEILKTLPAEMIPYYQDKVKNYYILM